MSHSPDYKGSNDTVLESIGFSGAKFLEGRQVETFGYYDIIVITTVASPRRFKTGGSKSKGGTKHYFLTGDFSVIRDINKDLL